MKSKTMRNVAYAVLLIGILSSLIYGLAIIKYLSDFLALISIISIILSTLLLFAILLSLAAILEKQELEEEYITKTLTLITDKLEQTK